MSSEVIKILFPTRGGDRILNYFQAIDTCEFVTECYQRNVGDFSVTKVILYESEEEMNHNRREYELFQNPLSTLEKLNLNSRVKYVCVEYQESQNVHEGKFKCMECEEYLSEEEFENDIPALDDKICLLCSYKKKTGDLNMTRKSFTSLKNFLSSNRSKSEEPEITKNVMKQESKKKKKKPSEEEVHDLFPKRKIKPPPPDPDHPVIINLSNCRFDIVYQAARKVGFHISEKTHDEDNTWTIFWMDKSSSSERVMRMRDYQRINHFPCMDAISNVKKLTRNMKKMNRKYPSDYNFYPVGFELPIETKSFFRYLNLFQGKDFTFAISYGRGLRKIILTQESEDVKKYDNSVVQMYIDNPLLMEGKKFDLRFYVLISSLKPLTLYMFQNGMVRICSDLYEKPTKENITNEFIHHMKKSRNSEYSGFRDGMYCYGNRRDFKFFRKWLEEEQRQDSEKIFESIEDILIKTVLAVYPHLVEKYDHCMTNEKKGGTFSCFEILGFEILLDEKFNPYLQRVWHSPTYSLKTKLDEQLKLDMLYETFLLLGIDPKKRKKTLQREKLIARRRLGKKINEREFLNVMMDKREKDVKRRKEAEENLMMQYKRIFPTRRTTEKFKHLIKQEKDSFFFDEVIFKKKK